MKMVTDDKNKKRMTQKMSKMKKSKEKITPNYPSKYEGEEMLGMKSKICECGRVEVNHPSESCKKFKEKMTTKKFLKEIKGVFSEKPTGLPASPKPTEFTDKELYESTLGRPFDKKPTEFNLSSCETHKTSDNYLWKKEQDIKTFIKKLKELTLKGYDLEFPRHRLDFLNEIDKLAGDSFK